MQENNFLKTQLIGLQTLIRKEITRIFRVWIQSLLPPVITTLLYFIIFGNMIGARIGKIHDISYVAYITPGLIMMAIIINSYSNVVSSFFSARFQKSVEELIVSPLSNSFIILGFVSAGVIRGLIVGILVTIVSLFFTHLHIQHLSIMLITCLLAATIFSLTGFCNALFARKFDDIAIVPTFILTPLTYLGGVFYSISMLPPIWQKISHLNPIVYLVSLFRYGMLGSDGNYILSSILLSIGFVAVLFSFNLYLLNKKVGVKV